MNNQLKLCPVQILARSMFISIVLRRPGLFVWSLQYTRCMHQCALAFMCAITGSSLLVFKLATISSGAAIRDVLITQRCATCRMTVATEVMKLGVVS